MFRLYPAIQPYADYTLQVDKIHSIYVEECGNPDGIPVLFLHGGPGIGCDAEHRRFFDPLRFRIILFDQRGSGRSKPHANLINNTTQSLVSDIEKIRNHCKVNKWILFGGSWGATLALIYAQKYPKHVASMVLRGTFLGRRQDLQWFYQEGGASRIFPEYWRNFVELIDYNKRDNLVKAYYELLTGEDEVICMAAAKSWSRWESVCATLDPNPHIEQQLVQPHVALGLARIESHYFVNKLFVEDNSILKNIHYIAHIPSVIVHGRYDMICPLDNAYELHTAWPVSSLHIVRDAGHAACEAGMINALISAIDEMGDVF